MTIHFATINSKPEAPTAEAVAQAVHTALRETATAHGGNINTYRTKTALSLLAEVLDDDECLAAIEHLCGAGGAYVSNPEDRAISADMALAVVNEIHGRLEEDFYEWDAKR